MIISQTPAQGKSLELEFIQGSSSKSQELAAEGDFGKLEEKINLQNTYNWNLSYTHTALQTTGLNDLAITDNSHDFVVGLGLDTASHFSLSLDGNYSVTPEENLRSLGPSLTAGYKYFFGPSLKLNGKEQDSEVSQSEDFKPFLGFDITFSALSYQQDFSAKPPARPGARLRPTAGTNDISQTSTEFAFKAKLLSWVKAKLAYTKYSYNKDVTQFLQYLDANQALANSSIGFNNALSGFYENTTEAALSFYFLEVWELDLKHSISKVISTQSNSTVDKVIAYVDPTTDWHLGIGFSFNYTSLSGETDRSTLLDLNYDF